MGLFTGIENAKPSFDAKYIMPGHYLCRIDRIKADRTRKGDDFLAVEMTVLHTFDDGDVNEKAGGRAAWHRPGESVSQLFLAKHDTFKGNVKAMVANLTGCHESEVTEADCQRICSEEQVLSGMIAEIKARTIITKAGQEFTKVSYVREFPAAELQDVLDEKILDTYFPGDTLANMIAEAND